MLDVSCDRADNDYDFQVSFAYTEYLIRKHINDTIAKKDVERKGRYDSRRAKKQPKYLQPKKNWKKSRKKDFMKSI
jgi:hypothetical protein